MGCLVICGSPPPLFTVVKYTTKFIILTIVSIQFSGIEHTLDIVQPYHHPSPLLFQIKTLKLYNQLKKYPAN